MHQIARKIFLASGLAIGVIGSFGCGSDSAKEATLDTPTFTAIYDTLFPVTTKSQCNFCHSLPPNDKSNGKLSMGEAKADAYAALVGKTSASSGCGGKSLVVPGHPESSLFLEKLSDAPSCGSRMPLGGAVLSEAELTMVKAWISAGAKND